jgi:hypothetical protein
MKPNGTETTTRGKWLVGGVDNYHGRRRFNNRSTGRDELRRQERREFSEVTPEEEIDCDRPSDEWCQFGDWLEEHDPERPIF